MTCMEALTNWGSLESYCPKSCVQEEDGGTVCQEGERPRNPERCGTTRCGNVLKSMVGSEDKMIDGFNTCTGDFAQYRLFGSYGADWIRTMWKTAALQCNHTDKYNVTISAETCMGAVWYIQGSQEACTQCDKTCSDFLESVDSDVFIQIPNGLKDCANPAFNGSSFEGAADQAEGAGVSYKEILSGLATGCGFEDRIKFSPKQNSNHTPQGCMRPVYVSAETYKGAMNQGLRPVPCTG